MASIALALPLTVLLPGVLGGCGDDTVDPAAPGSPTTPTTTPVTTPASTGPSAGAPAPLDGRTFLSTGNTGFDLVEGTTVRIDFRDGSLSASAGCNTLGGGYRLDGDTLLVDQLSMTEMGCEEALMLQDSRFGDLLTAGPTVTVEGDTLVLSAADVSITFIDRAVSDPDRPLETTVWTLTTIIDGDSASSVPLTAVSTLTIADGSAAVATGCNSGSATVTIADGTVAFGPLALTKMACEQSLMDLESAIVTVLEGDVTVTIDASVLTITSSSGTGGLQYSALDS